MRTTRVVLAPDVGVKPVEATLSAAVRKSPLTRRRDFLARQMIFDVIGDPRR
jgi:hypothetical protein